MGYKSSLFVFFSGMILIGINSPPALAEVICKPEEYKFSDSSFPPELCPNPNSSVVLPNRPPDPKPTDNSITLTWSLVSEANNQTDTQELVKFYRDQLLPAWKIDPSSTNELLVVTKDNLQATVRTDSADNPTRLIINVLDNNRTVVDNNRVDAQSSPTPTPSPPEDTNFLGVFEVLVDNLSQPISLGGALGLAFLVFILSIILSIIFGIIFVNKKQKKLSEELSTRPSNQSISVKQELNILNQELEKIKSSNSNISSIKSLMSQIENLENTVKGLEKEKKRLELIPPWQDIINTYESNPDSLGDRVWKVSETDNSVKRREENPECKEVTLIEQNNYNYLIIQDDRDMRYWTMPRPNLVPMRPGTSATFQKLFQITNPEKSDRRYRVLRPAEVKPSGREWQLVQPGIVEFY